MGTSLNGLTPAGTYPGLIKTGDNTELNATLKTLSDGNGNNLPIAVSTTTVNFTNQLQQGGVAVPTQANLAAKQDTLVSGTNIKTINGVTVLGSGNIVTPSTPPSGVAGAIQFSAGSAFNSDAANLFWDDTNNRLGVGTDSPSATAHFKSSGTTGATNSFIIQNSGGANLFRVRDDGNLFCEGGGALSSVGIIGTVYGLFGGASYEASASLVCGGTTTGFLPPRMTTTQKNAIASPATGLVLYDSTTNKLQCYNGSTWNDLF
jgi:hypothetical protein